MARDIVIGVPQLELAIEEAVQLRAQGQELHLRSVLAQTLLYQDRYEEALAHARRASELSESTRDGRVVTYFKALVSSIEDRSRRVGLLDHPIQGGEASCAA